MKNRDDLYRLVDVCMATSAAPLILPMYNTINPQDKTSQQYFIDGGLCLNNPALVALIEAKEILNQSNSNKKIQIFSLGTCDLANYDVVNKGNMNRGIWRWKVGVKISEVAMTSQSKTYDFIMKFLCGQDKNIEYISFKEFQSTPSVAQAEHIALDGASEDAINALLTLSQNDAEKVHSKFCADNKSCEAIKNLFS